MNLQETMGFPRELVSSIGDSMGDIRFSPVTRVVHRCFPHIMAVVTWGEPYVTTTKNWFRTQHPSPPNIQQNCYTVSSECTPKDHLTHHFLEIFPKWVHDLPKPLFPEGKHIVAHKFFRSGVFSSVTPSGHW